MAPEKLLSSAATHCMLTGETCLDLTGPSRPQPAAWCAVLLIKFRSYLTQLRRWPAVAR